MSRTTAETSGGRGRPRRAARRQPTPEALPQILRDCQTGQETQKSGDGFQQQLLEAIPAAIFTVDAQRRITSVNEAFCRITDLSSADVLGKKCDVLGGQSCAEDCILSDSHCDRSAAGRQQTIQAADGRKLTVLKSARILRDEDGSCIGAVESFADITELVQARQDAEKATLAKGQFVAKVSHEIRTAVNGIMGMTELAFRTEPTQEQWEYLNLVRDSTDSLLTLLDDVLDFSTLEAGRLRIESREFKLRSVVADTLETMAFSADSKGLELIGHVRSNVPDAVVGDPVRLHQIITNLVSNAIKFTEAGEVVLRVEVDQATGAEIRLHFTVRDTGIGISDGGRDRIFRAFEQADSSTAQRYGGTGLGLTIARQLVEMMGGRIWFDSRPGEGSTFHFTVCLGLQVGPAVAESLDEQVGCKGLPVLIVDDNATNRHVLAEILTSWHLETTCAANAQEAVDQMDRSVRNGRPYSVALVDAHMPEVDGFELAERIGGSSAVTGGTIMMLSLADLHWGRPRCRQLGVSACLAKPVKESELRRAVNKAIAGTQAVAADPESAGRKEVSESMQPLRILLAEDNPINQKVTCQMLGKWGHSVLIAGDGEEVLGHLQRESFDLVIMDVQMPGMNGLEATCAIRQSETGTDRHIPIIALTAHAMDSDVERCLEAGMDRYLSKPIRAAALFEEINDLLFAEHRPEKATAGSLEGAANRRSARTTRSPGSCASSVAGETDEEIFDKIELMERLSGDVALLSEIVEGFSESCPKLLSDVAKALDSGDGSALEQSAHALKGAVSNFAAKDVFDAAWNLEMAGREGRLGRAKQALAGLSERLSLLIPALKAFVKEEAACEC